MHSSVDCAVLWLPKGGGGQSLGTPEAQVGVGPGRSTRAAGLEPLTTSGCCPGIWKLVPSHLSCLPADSFPDPVSAGPLCPPWHVVTPPLNVAFRVAAAGSAGAQGRLGVSRAQGGHESRGMRTPFLLVLSDSLKLVFRDWPAFSAFVGILT